MSFSYPYAVKYSTREIVARAYKEYTAAISEAYSRLVDMTQLAVTEVESDSNVNDVVLNIINQYAEYGYTPDTMVSLNEGQVRLADFLATLATSSKLDLEAIDSESDAREYDAAIQLPRINEESFTTTVNDVLQQLNASYHSLVVENAIANCYDAGKTIAERITILRDTVSEKFKSAYTDVSNTLNQGVNKIKSGLDIVGYLEDKLKTSGIDAGADDGTKISESDDVHYTGASPATGYCWYSAGNVLISAGQKAVQVACNVVKTTFKGLFNLGKKVFSWATSKLKEILIDPKDFKEINGESGNHTFNGFYKLETMNVAPDDYLYPYIINGPLHCDFITSEIIIQCEEGTNPSKPYNDITTGFTRVLKHKENVDLDVSEGLLTGINNALSSNYDTLLEAASDIFTGDDILSRLNNYRMHNMTATVNILIKFKPINPAVIEGLVDGGSGHGLGYMYLTKDLIPCFDRLVDCNNMYLDVSSTEADFYKGMALGVCLTKLLIDSLELESRGYDISDPDDNGYAVYLPYAIDDIMTYIKTDLITNSDFIDLITQGKIFVDTDLARTGYVQLDVAINLFYILNNIFKEKELHPFDYGFWPYSRNMTSWFDSSFEVIPDEVNQARFDNFVTTAVIVAVVATIGIVTLVKLKKHANRVLATAMGAEWDVTEKAQKGILTDADIKKWKKLKRKANRVSWLNGNLMSSIGDSANNFESLNNYDDVMVNLDPVISLITG